jgi:1-acylglycerone phosphate reductase
VHSRMFFFHSPSRRVGAHTNLCRPSPWGGTYGASKAALHAFSDVLDMELRPLGVKLVLLAPGAVKTNIGVNQTAAHAPAPPDTLYTAYRGSINRRLTLSQGPGSMPAAVFAKQTVDAILRPSPPAYMSIAPFTWSAYLLSWLPRSTRLNILWKQYGQPVSGS